MYTCNEKLCFPNSFFFLKQVPDIKDEETYGAEGMASALDWKPQGSVSEGSIVGVSRKPILALSPQVGSSRDTFIHEHY